MLKGAVVVLKINTAPNRLYHVKDIRFEDSKTPRNVPRLDRTPENERKPPRAILHQTIRTKTCEIDAIAITWRQLRARTRRTKVLITQATPVLWTPGPDTPPDAQSAPGDGLPHATGERRCAM